MNAPLAAAVALPVSLLSLQAAYRLWSLLQLALLVAAVVVAIRAAPGRRSLPPLTLIAVGLGALACLGTLATLLLGQWDGLSALGLAVAYACLRGRRPATAGAVLAVTALVAKPHLALGLAAFVIGMRDRRLLLGAAGGVVASLLLSLLVASPAGIAGFVGAAIHSTTRWQLANMVSLVGISGAIAGNGTASHVLAAVGSVVAVAIAAALGSAARSRPARLEAALAGAAVLSLLASPHAYWDDLALLVPALAWSFTALAARPGGARRLGAGVVAAWIAISVAAFVDIASDAARPWGVLTPWVLIGAAALAIATCYRQGDTPPSAIVGTGTLRSWDPRLGSPPMSGRAAALIFMVVLGVAFAGLSFGASKLLASQRPTAAKQAPYECGIVPTHEPARRFPVRFYLVAMAFVVVDIEIIFLFPWAVDSQDLGRFGMVEILVFAASVFVPFIYLVANGALDWGPLKRVRPVASQPVRTSSSTVRHIGPSNDEAA